MSNYSIIITNMLLTIFTGLLTFFTYLLLRVAQRQSKDANSVSRAFVVFKGVRFYSPKEFQKPWLFELEWENCGTTQTKNMIYHTNWKIFETKELNDNYSFPDLGDNKGIPLVIGPKQTVVFKHLEISNIEIENVKHNKKRLLIWGWAKYYDIFEGTPQRHTNFCYELIFYEHDQTLMQFAVTYKQYNDAD